MVDHDGDDIICRENDHLAVMDEAHETRGYKGKDRETNRAATVFNDVSGSQAEAEAEADSYRHYQVCPKCTYRCSKIGGLFSYGLSPVQDGVLFRVRSGG